jgi:hypothetical protein
MNGSFAQQIDMDDADVSVSKPTRKIPMALERTDQITSFSMHVMHHIHQELFPMGIG